MWGWDGDDAPQPAHQLGACQGAAVALPRRDAAPSIKAEQLLEKAVKAGPGVKAERVKAEPGVKHDCRHKLFRGWAEQLPWVDSSRLGIAVGMVRHGIGAGSWLKIQRVGVDQ